MSILFCSILLHFNMWIVLSWGCRRQRRTASHPIQRLEELKSRGCLCRPVLCSVHPGQELRLFCQACDLPVCLECAATLHCDHRCCPTHDVIHRHGDRIRELVTVRLRPHLEQLEQTLQRVKKSLFCLLLPFQVRNKQFLQPLAGGHIPGDFADTGGSDSERSKSVCTRLRQRRGGSLPVSAAQVGGAPPPTQV